MTRVIVIGGPTASGKSGLALTLAQKMDGIVINADSMQMYRGLPILTAQPSSDDMTAAPHRLYAVLSPEKTCSAADWRDMALAEIKAAEDRGKIAIVVGGTGFYLKALLEGLSSIPDVAPHFREEAIALQKEMGNPGFHAYLATLDPKTAQGLDPLNTQRVVRAYEVLKGTGQGLAQWQKLPRVGPPGHLEFLRVALIPSRDVLYAACDARFAQMMDQGALEEARAFRASAPLGAALGHALGYQELCAYEDGQICLEEAIGQARQSTRNYAKRQVTWFKHQFAADIVLDKPEIATVLNIM